MPVYWYPILQYVLGVLTDGDYLSDWLSHLPPTLHDTWLHIGYALYMMLFFWWK